MHSNAFAQCFKLCSCLDRPDVSQYAWIAIHWSEHEHISNLTGEAAVCEPCHGGKEHKELIGSVP